MSDKEDILYLKQEILELRNKVKQLEHTVMGHSATIKCMIFSFLSAVRVENDLEMLLKEEIMNFPPDFDLKAKRVVGDFYYYAATFSSSSHLEDESIDELFSQNRIFPDPDED